jgi:hypothetical protein
MDTSDPSSPDNIDCEACGGDGFISVEDDSDDD